MTFKLSANSMSKMTGIKNELHTIVCEAIRLTKVDFGVICGLRTQEEQDALLAKGATQTKTSKHMTGDEQTRMGVRYPELLSFIASYNESRFTAIEARLTALEGA